jgi:hypothetical protein
MNSFQQLHNLYEEELYSNAHTLAGFLLSNPAHFKLKQEEIFCTFVISAER